MIYYIEHFYTSKSFCLHIMNGNNTLWLLEVTYLEWQNQGGE